jgi:membrane-associated protease RseP (regulator of RpoE activity)
MALAVGLLVLLVGLLLSIGLHELGHMIPAKRFGVRVSRYMIGFGPTVWSRTWGDTEYGIKAIPLGGYVKIVGMLAPAEAVGAKPRSGVLGQMMQDARDASAEEILPGEEDRAFYRLSTPKKIVVMASGTLTNLVVAVLLFGIVLVGLGLPGAASTTVGVTLPCVLPVDAPADRECTAQDPPAPVALADLRVGDVLLSYGGVPIETWDGFLAAVKEVDGSDIPLVVERSGEQVTLAVSPIVVERPVRDDAGEPIVGPDGEIVTEPSRYIGFSPTSVRERQSVGEVLPAVGDAVSGTLDLIVHLPWRLWDIAGSLISGGERDASVMGLVGMGQVAGNIATADGPGIEVTDRVALMLYLVASLNVALFAFNLIPLLPLDGGHVAGALWEGAKRQVAQWRGRPRPAPADMARMMPLANGVFVVLVLMGLFLVVADIVSPVTG